MCRYLSVVFLGTHCATCLGATGLYLQCLAGLVCGQLASDGRERGICKFTHGQVRMDNSISSGLCALFIFIILTLFPLSCWLYLYLILLGYFIVCHGQKLPGPAGPAEGDLFRPLSSALEAAWLASVRPTLECNINGFCRDEFQDASPWNSLQSCTFQLP